MTPPQSCRIPARSHFGSDSLELLIGKIAAVSSNHLLLLGTKDFETLAGMLNDHNLARLPANLYSDQIIGLTVRVINYRTNILARNFAGQDRITHGDMQNDFDAIRSTLMSVQRKVLAEGLAVSLAVLKAQSQQGRQ